MNDGVKSLTEQVLKMVVTRSERCANQLGMHTTTAWENSGIAILPIIHMKL